MPNRILKESVCTSDSVDSLSWFEECFFYRLIVNCDDYGRMDARPAILKARLFPLKDITHKNIADALQALRAAGLVELYEVDAHPYLQLCTWDRHQQVRAKKGKFPAPDGNYGRMQPVDSACNHLIADDCKCSRNPIQSESNPNPNPTRADDRRGEDENADLRALAARQEAVFEAMKDAGLPQSAKSLQLAERLVADYSAEWVLEAINRMASASASAQNLRYVEGILKSWKQRGGIDPPDQPHGSAKHENGGAKPGEYVPPLPQFIL